MSVSINHVAVFVRDLEAVRSFYETYFEAVANDQYHNPRTGLRTYFLTFEGGCRLELMTRPESRRPDPPTRWAGRTPLSLSALPRPSISWRNA